MNLKKELYGVFFVHACIIAEPTDAVKKKDQEKKTEQKTRQKTEQKTGQKTEQKTKQKTGQKTEPSKGHCGVYMLVEMF